MTRPIFGFLVFAAGMLAHASAAAEVERRFTLVVHVATSDASDADARLDALLGSASRLFEPAGIGFTVEGRRELDGSYAILETIRERRQLSKFFVPRVINVFLVDEIRDPNPSEATRRAARAQGRAPSGRLSGAHIPIKGREPDTYIIVARTRSAASLAHELGHFFGVPHSQDPANIMSYGSSRVRFSEKQIEVFRRKAARFRRTRWVRSSSADQAATETGLHACLVRVSRVLQRLPAYRGPRL